MQLTYDSPSRVTGETQGPNPLGSSGKTVSYTYDAEGNRTKIDYPDGFGGSAFDANESRDALGRLSSVTDGGSNQIAAFDLYGAGARKKKVTLANSTTANYAWDGFRRPTDIDRGVIKFSRAGPIGTTIKQLLDNKRDGWTWFNGPGSSISVVDESSRPGDDAGKNKRLVDHELGHVDVFERLYKSICGGSGAGAGIDKTAWEAAVTGANDQYHKGPKDGGVGDDGAPSDAAKKKAVQAGVDAYNKVVKKP